MNKSILITGANIGLGKETARQLALDQKTERIILACRNSEKAAYAKADLEKETGRQIFEILLMDVSNPASVKSAVEKINDPIDAVILNAGGMGGMTPNAKTESGMNQLSAVNILGHVVLIDELLKAKKIKKAVLLASSEAVRGVKKMGMKAPDLKTSSVDEFASILDGSYFGNKFDVNQAYGHVKYAATMWMSSLARQYPSIQFISMSPGATKGTAVADNIPFALKVMYKYIMFPIVMPMMGMVHNVNVGAKRYVDGISNDTLESGAFYASPANKVTGPITIQSQIYPDLINQTYQDNANQAIHRFIN